jgi:SagB-type dehydrogenase family enzyme
MTLIPRLHTDLRRTRVTRRGAAKVSKTRRSHKKYPRLPNLILPAPHAISLSPPADPEGHQAAKNSRGKFSLETCGALLGVSLKTQGDPAKRPYPSKQDLYPVETYLITTAIEGTPPGVFHYDPDSHTLETLTTLPVGFPINDLVHRKDTVFHSLIVFTALWGLSLPRHGDFAYILALIEAGHMSQNILLAADVLLLTARPTSTFDDDAIAELLDIDMDQEQPIHAIYLC